MLKLKQFLFINILAGGIVACGFKGPLYLPPKNNTASSQPTTVRTQSNNKYAPSAPVTNKNSLLTESFLNSQ